MSLTGIKLYYAKFFNENNEHIKDKWFQKDKDKFKWKNKAYNHKPSGSLFYETKGLLWDRRYYIYRKDCPEPVRLDKLDKYKIVGKRKNKKDKIKQVSKVLLDPEQYHTLLETEQLKKLNQPQKSGILDYVEPKHIVILISIILAIVYLVRGGYIF